MQSIHFGANCFPARIQKFMTSARKDTQAACVSMHHQREREWSKNIICLECTSAATAEDSRVARAAMGTTGRGCSRRFAHVGVAAPSVWFLLLFVAMTLAKSTVAAFVVPVSQHQLSSTVTRRNVSAQKHQSSTSTTRLFMSDLPSPNEKKPKFWKDRLPPSPEDQLVMTGDIMALFVYSFMDHTLNEWYVDMVTSNMGDPSVLDPSHGLLASQVPVWWDGTHLSTGLTSEHLLTLLGLQGISYSPAIGTAGLASVVLSSCWLLSGYIHQAFLFRNTLQCDTSRALLVTGKTWVTTCVLMCLLAVGSHIICPNCVNYGLSKADADYIFDSLTVLVTWRFLVSWMLGTGK